MRISPSSGGGVAGGEACRAVYMRTNSVQGLSPPLHTRPLSPHPSREVDGQSSDGRYHRKCYLVDQAGCEHLAITWDEKDPRDGHYVYTVVGAGLPGGRICHGCGVSIYI